MRKLFSMEIRSGDIFISIMKLQEEKNNIYVWKLLQ